MCVKPDRGVRVPSVELCTEGLASYEAAVRGDLPEQECPQCLLDLGLLRELPDGRLMALPPGLAANAVMRPLETDIEEKQRALAAARVAMHQAEEIYRAHTGTGTGTGIRAISGADAISATLSSVVQSCEEELLTAQPGGGRPAALLEKALASDVAALERGIRQRTIYQHTVRSHGPTLAYVEQISVAGAEVRTLDEVFDRLIVCDRKIAFVPDPGEERRQLALVIEHPGMIRYLVGIFDKSWERAAPLRHTPTEHRPPLLTDETRRAVLHLMVNGYTDETIAGRLGMSARTVATHVRKASEQLGSRSRAQLAYLIASSGILDEDLYTPTPAPEARGA
ncbi:LuxR C-terminal-related transcriptional regulator [Streptomyces erythrochromogenes]|uniref:LuxR C-terminal-related transcriptional regulator n=1 Tax=Streptomyces erythrochromogenes TaxID=285574 RepID=UPI003700721A